MDRNDWPAGLPNGLAGRRDYGADRVIPLRLASPAFFSGTGRSI
jgi:hypothetical protein